MFERNPIDKSNLIKADQINKIYLPLAKKIQKLAQDNNSQTFIVGVTGPVSVGKSTTTELLADLLKQENKQVKVQTLTTDGFLYPNDVLKAKGLFERKGFPESYDYQRIIDFLRNVKVGADNVLYPLYSHTISDVISDRQGVINKPDILIIEGINLLQTPADQDPTIRNYLDLSIYLDADEDQIEEWYLVRFHRMMDINRDDPTNFFYSWAHKPLSKADKFAKQVWRDINLPNNLQYIEPTKVNADIILHKVDHHLVNDVNFNN